MAFMINLFTYVASEKGHEDIVKLLIDHRADINAKDNLGETPLHKAAINNNKKILRILIADVNIQNKNGKTALDIGIIKFKIKSVFQLILII